MRFGDAAEQVVQIAHDVLVGANHKHAEVINFAGNDAMKRKRVANILKIREFGNFAVGIASDVDNRALPIRGSCQAMDRHDRKKLTESPVVEERLKDGKIADVLIAERSLEFLHFVGHVTQTAMHVDDLL